MDEPTKIRGLRIRRSNMSTVITPDHKLETADAAPEVAHVAVRLSHASWGWLSVVEQSSSGGSPRRTGRGARRAVRKYGAAFERLAAE
jgi:hypothetical protein